MNNQFKLDVDKGLSSSPKFLSSKYFYDEIGDKLFVKITELPEYYLTKAEYEIFRLQSKKIVEVLQLKTNTYFELVELGVGNGKKTKELIKELIKSNYQFDYIPIDISSHTLFKLEQSLNVEIPKLRIKKRQGDYFEILKSLKSSNHQKVVLFLGSSIGNLTDSEASKFISELGECLNPSDKLLLGLDLIKPKSIVLPAYNDITMVTAKFNLNLLERINRELGGNFNINCFSHQAEYDENIGIASSFLVSQKHQSVTVSSIKKTYNFFRGEKIHTEISRKYNDKILSEIIKNTSFRVVEKLTDLKKYFADYILNRD